jgi:hypothetical protein
MISYIKFVININKIMEKAAITLIARVIVETSTNKSDSNGLAELVAILKRRELILCQEYDVRDTWMLYLNIQK